MKFCSGCSTTRPEDMFSFKNKKLNKRVSRCKICIRAYNKQHYRNNPKTYKECSKRNNLKKLSELRSRLLEYLKDKSCLVCNEDDSIVLQFDHLNPETKNNTISAMIRGKYSWDTILAEIEKCQILCANCHARKTAQQQNWYKWVSG